MKKATFDPSKRLDLYFRINRNGSKAFSFFNVSGTARSLIYEEYSLVIRKFQGGPVYITLPLTIDTNVITATITESLSRINEGEYYWELIRVDLGKTWLNGKAVFHNGVFDGVDTDTTDITIAESTETINITISESGTGGSDPIVYTSGNAVEVGTDNKVGWGNQFTKNTSIPGDSVNVELGTTDSRLNRFLFRVADLFEVLMPIGGTWRAIVGTAQLLMNSESIGILHDSLIEFQRAGADRPVMAISTVDGIEGVDLRLYPRGSNAGYPTPNENVNRIFYDDNGGYDGYKKLLFDSGLKILRFGSDIFYFDSEVKGNIGNQIRTISSVMLGYGFGNITPVLLNVGDTLEVTTVLEFMTAGTNQVAIYFAGPGNIEATKVEMFRQSAAGARKFKIVTTVTFLSSTLQHVEVSLIGHPAFTSTFNFTLSTYNIYQTDVNIITQVQGTLTNDIIHRGTLAKLLTA